MLLGEVIGKVSSTQKLDTLRGLTLVVIRPVNHKGEPTGNIIVAIDPIGVGIGQRVLYMTGGSAGKALERYNIQTSCDAAVVGIVDSLNIVER